MTAKDVHRDRALFAGISQGNTQAFNELFNDYYDQLRFNAIRLVKSEYWAEEVVQEVFLQVWLSRASLTEIESPASWLFKLCANRCFDRLRRSKNEAGAQYVIGLMQQQQADFTELHPHFDFTQLKKVVKEAIDQLPAQQQAVYKLQLEEDLSYQQIADRLGLSIHTVRNHLVRAVKSVRGYLIQHAPHLLPVFFFFCRLYIFFKKD